MATILITGVTGMVGSSLAPLLKSEGHQLICLVRPKNGQAPIDRLSSVLGQLNKSEVIWNGDVTLPHAGVSNEERKKWKGRIDKVVHCAASIKFDEASAEMTSKINIDGTSNILELATELKIPEIHHISTAYVAGDADYFSENDFDIGQTCRNIYEKTKKESERLIRSWQSGRYSIYRLGIAVGDSVTGFTPNFNGYYRPFAFFWYLRQILKCKTEERLKKYEDEGIAFDADGMLILPLCINCSPVSTLNLAPRDWIARILSNLIEIAAIGQTFHVVHPRPSKIRWITDISLHSLGIKGYRYGEKPCRKPHSLLGNLQKKFERSIREYLPYVIHESAFESNNTARVIGNRYLPPPDIDEDFLVTLLKYAKSVNFGRKSDIKAVKV